MVKKILILSLLLISSYALKAQNNKYSTFYYQRASLFEQLPVKSSDIIFLGNSITNGGEWAELFNNPNVKNRGISGDRTNGVYDRLDAILKGKPKKIFLLIGINDLNHGLTVDSILSTYAMIVEKIQHDSPKTKLYLQSVLPVTTHYNMFSGHTAKAAQIPVLNAGIKKIAHRSGVTYIDIYTPFLDPKTGVLDTSLTNDGLHLMGAGYKRWAELVKPYVK